MYPLLPNQVAFFASIIWDLYVFCSKKRHKYKEYVITIRVQKATYLISSPSEEHAPTCRSSSTIAASCPTSSASPTSPRYHPLCQKFSYLTLLIVHTCNISNCLGDVGSVLGGSIVRVHVALIMGIVTYVVG
jgi:hypothetical protein